MVGMGMSMGMRQSLSMRQHLALEQRLTLEQRQKVDSLILTMRLDLIGSLREERYQPKARCPRCVRELKPIEIVQGFNRDPNDFTTGCPRCKHRFQPSLICFAEGGNIELPFFCGSQALHQLKDKVGLTPHELLRDHPALYRSAITHHGSIRAAFQAIGAPYPFEEISDWRHKVTPFLGRLPDTMIASCVGASSAVILSMRKKLGIRKFSRHNLLEKGYRRRSRR